ncbi:MAG: hypothetical protein OXB86_05480, partial [Bdellovibrionales bacterium]|nr:hypothetical protein [Bdellovibrionales bacterium]
MRTFDILLICDHALIYTSDQSDDKSFHQSTKALLPSKRFIVEKDKAVGITAGRIAFVGDITEDLKAKKTYR